RSHPECCLRTGAHIGRHGLLRAPDTVRARAVWLADGERRAHASWRMMPLGHLRANPVDAADGALGSENLPLPPVRIERDPTPASCPAGRDRESWRDGLAWPASGPGTPARWPAWPPMAPRPKIEAVRPRSPAAGRRILRRRSTCCSGRRYERIV